MILLNRFIFTFLISISCCYCGYSQQYHYYFGNTHSHSSYSDGNSDHLLATPLEDYNYAKKSLHFDFLGISDHNHMMTPYIYQKGLSDADSANENGKFVSLFGMEWGVYANGHIVIYGYDSLIGWNQGDYDIFNDKTDYQGLFSKILTKNGAFAMLAHPSNSNFSNLLTSNFSEVADEAIVGMPLRNGYASSTDTSYSNPPNSDFQSYFNKLLAKGYHPGIGIDHDNHKTNFGRSAQSRLVVLADSLTKPNILEAIKNRRFYASDDWNCQVNFTVNTKPMGSVFSGSGAANIFVNVIDLDTEFVSNIKIYSGISGSGTTPTIIASITNSDVYEFKDSIYNSKEHYYYAVITQADGDEMITSPIWYSSLNAATNDLPHNSDIFNIYPNPSSGIINIKIKENQANDISISICNILGEKVSENEIQNPPSENISFDLSGYPNGVYFVKIQYGTQNIVQKFSLLK